MSMIGGYVRLEETELKRLVAEPAELPDFLFSDALDDSDARLDIDKTWHVIHFLLSGDPWEGDWPLGAAVLGGAEIGTEDMSYGPARFLTPAQAKQAMILYLS